MKSPGSIAHRPVHSDRQPYDHSPRFELFDKRSQPGYIACEARPAYRLNGADRYAKLVRYGCTYVLRTEIYGEHTHLFRV